MEGNRNYGVGYGRPPRATQFQKGQSGNPKGRPKKENSEQGFWDTFQKMMEKPVATSERGKRKKIPVKEALIISTMKDALKGDKSAQRILFGLLERAPYDQHSVIPQINIHPPHGPRPPMPPIYMGEDQKKEDGAQTSTN